MSIKYYIESIQCKPVSTKWTFDKIKLHVDKKPFQRNDLVDKVSFDKVSYILLPNFLTRQDRTGPRTGQDKDKDIK